MEGLELAGPTDAWSAASEGIVVADIKQRFIALNIPPNRISVIAEVGRTPKQRGTLTDCSRGILRTFVYQVLKNE